MHILQDLRIAARQFRKTPGFAITTIATLALGIGASTAIFSLVEGVTLRPLPFPQPGQLLWLQQVDTSGGLTARGGPVSEPLSYPLPLTSADIDISFTIEGRPVAPGDELNAAVGIVTPGYFDTLRIPILAGRTFTVRDGTKATPVVIRCGLLMRDMLA